MLLSYFQCLVLRQTVLIVMFVCEEKKTENHRLKCFHGIDFVRNNSGSGFTFGPRTKQFIANIRITELSYCESSQSED
jgi:hypothetical protein